MTITSELIGKLGGGADVEVTPVEGAASGSMDSKSVFHTVEVPEGETWLIVLHGDLQSDRGNHSAAHLYIGDTIIDGNSVNGINSLAHVGTGTIEMGIRRNRSLNSDTFTGHVYTVKL